MLPLDGPNLKINRAHQHFTALKAEIDAYIEAHKIRVVPSELNATADNYVLRAQVPEPPPLEWGVVIGEIAHDLRSALDGIVWQSIILNGIDPETLSFPKSEFPIYLEESAFLKEGKPKIANRVRPHHEAFIERLQPFHIRQSRNPLWLLHQLNIADKHRLLQVAIPRSLIYAFGSNSKLNSLSPSPVTLTGEQFLIDGAVMGTIRRDVVEEKMGHLAVKAEVAFWEGCDAVEGLPVVRTLFEIGKSTSHILSQFAANFR